MERIKAWLLDNCPWLIVGFVILLCSLFIIFGTRNEDGTITVGGGQAVISEGTKQFTKNADEALIKYSEEAIPAKVVLENGEETLNLPTIDFIDGAEVPSDSSNEQDGRGAVHDTTTYLTYYNSVGIGTCINNSFGAQCFALANDFWANYTGGRALSSCGTGAAKGTLNCWEYNAGDEFEMVWNPKDVQPGDWVVTTGGTWGHIFMAMGYYNNGYIAGFGQNQGGGYCPLGGAATNVANIKVDSFGGAFRPKTYISPEPEPEPIPKPSPVSISCDKRTLVWGDTLSRIMKLCEGKVEWGEAMTSYAQSWVDEVTGKTVWEGWNSGSGVGLFSGHTIVRK